MNTKAEYCPAVQVVNKKGKSKETQTELMSLQCKSVGTQCGESNGSYQRKKCEGKALWRYDRLKDEVLVNKSVVIS